MAQNNTTVLLPIEIKRREITGKLLLSLIFAQRGYEVYIGSRDLLSSIDIIEPDVCFALSAVKREGRLSRMEKLKKCSTTTVVLDTEGSAFGGIDEFLPRVSPDILKYTDLYCAWGSKAATAAEMSYESEDLEIKKTGNPRFDLLQDPYQVVYQPDREQIEKQYGSFVLFNTNFSINHCNIEHHRSNTLGDKETYQTQSRLVGSFINAIGRVATELEKKNIVIRPHPSEDPSLYRRLLFPYDNVYVSKEGEVRPWILAAEAVVHNSCTTGVTSALLGTPVFAYIPDELLSESVPNAVSNQINTLDDLNQALQSVMATDEEYTLSETQKSRLSPHIDNLDYVSSERIVGAIETLEGQGASGFTQNFKPDRKQQVKRMLVKVLGDSRFEHLYYQRLKGGRETEYKFSETTTDDIKEYIHRFPNDMIPERITVEPIEEIVYGFRVVAE